MWRRILTRIILTAQFVLACVPTALGQSTASTSEDSSRSPALAYAVAFLSTIMIMVIMCMPSRKR